jgi:hypothetical protein
VQPGESTISLRVQVALEDAEAHSGLIVGLVGIHLGLLVSGHRGNSVVVFAPAHYAIIVSRLGVHNGMGLLRAERRPKTAISQSHSVWESCLNEALE